MGRGVDRSHFKWGNHRKNGNLSKRQKKKVVEHRTYEKNSTERETKKRALPCTNLKSPSLQHPKKGKEGEKKKTLSWREKKKKPPEGRGPGKKNEPEHTGLPLGAAFLSSFRLYHRKKKQTLLASC